jgi:hypothetical protein
MQQKFTPFSPFQPKTKSDNKHRINNIAISLWPKKAKPKRGKFDRIWRVTLDDELRNPSWNQQHNQIAQANKERNRNAGIPG